MTDALGVKACQEDPQACQSEGGLGNVENLIQQKARLYVRQARMLTSRTLLNLEGLGLARTQSADAPQRLRKWLDQLRAPTLEKHYDSYEQLTRVLNARYPRLTPAVFI